VDIVAKSLQKHGFSAAALHGDLDQSVRTRTLDSFRAGELRLLVASDVAARGLDIPAVSHIFNFDVPFQADDYVHRIGRTGRAGRIGHAFMLVTHRDEKNVTAIEKLIGQPIARSSIEVAPEDQRAPERPRDRSRRDNKKPSGHSHSHSRRPNGRPANSHPFEASAVQPVPNPPREAHPEPTRQRQDAPHPKAHAPAEPRPAPKGAHTRDAAELPAFLLRPVKLPALKPARKPGVPDRQPEPSASES